VITLLLKTPFSYFIQAFTDLFNSTAEIIDCDTFSYFLLMANPWVQLYKPKDGVGLLAVLAFYYARFLLMKPNSK